MTKRITKTAKKNRSDKSLAKSEAMTKPAVVKGRLHHFAWGKGDLEILSAKKEAPAKPKATN
jgi:hypothetical protein